jgi:hypothetical protein
MYATCLVGIIIYPSNGCIHFITSFKPSNNKGCHDVFLFLDQMLKLKIQINIGCQNWCKHKL